MVRTAAPGSVIVNRLTGKFMSAPSSKLSHGLSQAAGTVGRGLWGAAFCRVLALLAALALVAGLSDYLFGWEMPVRWVWASLGGLLLVGGLAWAWRRSRLSLDEAARRADDATGNARGEIQTGWELASREAAMETGTLHEFLSRRAITRASVRLATLAPSQLSPRREWSRGLRWGGLALLALGAVCLLNPRATGIIAGRLARPWQDLPPYSPHVFKPVDEAPVVIYGRDAVLAMDISGPPLKEAVRLLTRSGKGKPVEELPTFRESGARHVRKLDGVTEPLEYAFAVGRARSAWLPLEVLYQPQLDQAEIEVAPPAYAKLEGSRFALGTQELRGLRGSRVRLVASSNRPLAGGSLEGRAPQGREVLKRVQGKPVTPGGKEAEFIWEVDADLVWTLDLRDVRGGRMEDPVLLAQRLIPDEKPKVDLVSPGAWALATPGSEVKLAWEVEDDFGLDRLDWLRSAEGFRDRATTLEEGPGEKRLRLERTALLSNLGVRPGQTLEFVLEARDSNPSLLGVSGSQTARVMVISEEEYAAQIRLRTTLEEYAERYRLLREHLEAAQAALEAVAEAARSGDPAKLKEAREAAAAAQKAAAEWFERFAKDFPAFATDRQLGELSGNLREELEKNAQALAQEEGWQDPQKAQALAGELKKRLEPGAAELREQEEQAAEIAAVGGVLEMAAELQEIRREQAKISERLEHLARELALGRTDNRGEVPSLRARQIANEERLGQARQALPERLSKLPEGYGSLKEGGEKVARLLDELQVAKQMKDSAEQAGQGKVPGAAEDAGLALANLDQILGREKDDFCKAGQGETPGFCSGDGLAEQAMAQMLEALRGRCQAKSRGQGQGQGEGGGAGASGMGMMAGGGRGGSGATMQGIQLDIPIIGPPRLHLAPTGGGGMAGPARDPRGTTGVARVPATQGALPVGEKAAAGGRAWTPADVPPRYRDAVRKFFSEEPQPSQP